MSPQPPSLSPDLQRLQDEGYGTQLRGAQLLVSVPYVNSAREVKWGRLVSPLELAGDQTARPDIHVVWFIGEIPGDLPCDSSGVILDRLIYQQGDLDLGGGLVASCAFSRRPTNEINDYFDYYDKMSTYAGMLLAEAQAVDDAISLRDHPPIETIGEESVFRYEDSATTRARTGAVADRIRGQRIAIVGLGGTGSYVLDAVAKTPVGEIHLFDADVLLTHNAFRAPGAPSLEQLNLLPLKVDHHQRTYDAMHRHIVAHAVRIASGNLHELESFDFVFVSVDAGPDKLAVVEWLQGHSVPFADTGMGIYQHGTSLGGIVRTSLSSPRQVDPAWMTHPGGISFAADDDGDYSQNIQIAELNMFNAALAVITWKKYFGFYLDFERERSINYTIDGNHMLSEGGTSNASS